MSKLWGQTGQTLKLETSMEERDLSGRQERCAHQSYGEEVLVPSCLQPPSPLSNEHNTVFPLDGSRSTNTRAHLFSKAQIILNHPTSLSERSSRRLHQSQRGLADSEAVLSPF